MAKDIREHLIDCYMAGFRSAVAGQALPLKEAAEGAFARGYTNGQNAVLDAVDMAGWYADRVLGSPAMVQARRNAGLCGICGQPITGCGIKCSPGCPANAGDEVKP